MIYGVFQIDESEVLDARGAAYITVGDLVQEIHHLRADIASKDAALKSAKSELESIHRHWYKSSSRYGDYSIDIDDNVMDVIIAALPPPLFAE